jgi:hypothetical protein
VTVDKIQEIISQNTTAEFVAQRNAGVSELFYEKVKMAMDRRILSLMEKQGVGLPERSLWLTVTLEDLVQAGEDLWDACRQQEQMQCES